MSTFAEKYKSVKFLGRGNFGRVIQVQSCKTKKTYAAKIISLENLKQEEIDRANQQHKIHAKLSHPNIIQLYESFVENYEREKSLIIVMEFCEYGDLQFYINRRCQVKGGYFQESLVMNIFIQILYGLSYLHSCNVLHRDIKPSNIFVDSDGRVKLADFGLSKVLSQTCSIREKKTGENISAILGTPTYLSPELCQNEPVTFSSDIWAVGCVLYQMCALRPPFEAENILALATMIALQQVPNVSKEHYSSDLNALIHWMLDKCKKNRPQADQILHLSFINRYIKQFMKNEKEPMETSPLKKEQANNSTVLHTRTSNPEQSSSFYHSLSNFMPKRFQIIQNEIELIEGDEKQQQEYVQQMLQIQQESGEQEENYYPQLEANCITALSSRKQYQQMYGEIKAMKEIMNKNSNKINAQLFQIYGREYFDIAKAVAEIVDHDSAMGKHRH